MTYPIKTGAEFTPTTRREADLLLVLRKIVAEAEKAEGRSAMVKDTVIRAMRARAESAMRNAGEYGFLP